MIVVSNSSPLITLAKINHLELLGRLYERVTIPAEVHAEVVVAGAGLLLRTDRRYKMRCGAVLRDGFGGWSQPAVLNHCDDNVPMRPH